MQRQMFDPEWESLRPEELAIQRSLLDRFVDCIQDMDFKKDVESIQFNLLHVQDAILYMAKVKCEDDKWNFVLHQLREIDANDRKALERAHKKSYLLNYQRPRELCDSDDFNSEASDDSRESQSQREIQLSDSERRDHERQQGDIAQTVSSSTQTEQIFAAQSDLDQLRSEVEVYASQIRKIKDFKCSICNDKFIDCILGCRHCFCNHCSKKFNSCPLCRAAVQSRNKIFI